MVAAFILAAALSSPQSQIKIDIPVDLAEANVVFNIMDRGPLPGRQESLFLCATMTGVLASKNVPRKVIAVFHSAAAALACNDQAFNRLTGTRVGNPYTKRIAELQAAGVQTEICVKSMEFQNIKNSELLPGIKVNGGALLRIVELTQKGYTQLAF
ncbi:MAG: DsrE family protein [Fimbriimonadaceae bacterium]|nr:DsrE family protein [Fimbriimonadaceae bacterium]